MAKDLLDLKTQTRTYLDEVAAADWRDNEVLREINDKYMEVYTAVVDVFEDYYSTKATTNLIDNQQEYALPSDFYKVRRLEVNYDPDNTNASPRRARPINMDQVMRDLGNSSISTSLRSPSYYLRGNSFGLLPIPDESGADAITLWYIRMPTLLSADTDEVEIPFSDRYGGLISLGAAGTLLRKGQQEEIVARAYLAEFQMGLEKMKAELEDRAADNIKTIVDTMGESIDFSIPF